jgi:hypothetical protein
LSNGEIVSHDHEQQQHSDKQWAFSAPVPQRLAGRGGGRRRRFVLAARRGDRSRWTNDRRATQLHETLTTSVQVPLMHAAKVSHVFVASFMSHGSPSAITVRRPGSR